MKTLLTKITVCFIFIGILTSCAIDPSNKIRGNKNIVSLEREVTAPFDKITVSQGIKLYISLEKDATIVVETDENLHEYLKTEINEGVLKIHFDGYIATSKAKKVYITTPDLQSIKASSGSLVKSENILTGERLQVNTSSGASMELEVDTNDLFAKSSSGSSIELVGNTKNYESESSSGSRIDSYELISTYATAKVSSGAHTSLFVENELIAKASSGGSIKYKGNPKLRDNKASSGGRISQH